MNELITCNHCILDTSDLDITFDEHGVCCHCNKWLPRIKTLPKGKSITATNLASIKQKIRLKSKISDDIK